jgi:hypothetical protein
MMIPLHYSTRNLQSNRRKQKPTNEATDAPRNLSDATHASYTVAPNKTNMASNWRDVETNLTNRCKKNSKERQKTMTKKQRQTNEKTNKQTNKQTL